MTSKSNNLDYEERMQLAIHAADAELTPNYSAIAKKFDLEHTTLAKRYKGQTTSKTEANSLYRNLLNHVQEEQLVKQINKLTLRQMPPTVQIVWNMAEEIIGKKVNKNWTSHFVHRHQTRFKSLYLRNIDNLRAKAEFAPMFKHFYELVCILRYSFGLIYRVLDFG